MVLVPALELFVLAYGQQSLSSYKKFGNAWQGNAFEVWADLYRGGYRTYSTSRLSSGLTGC